MFFFDTARVFHAGFFAPRQIARKDKEALFNRKFDEE